MMVTYTESVRERYACFTGTLDNMYARDIDRTVREPLDSSAEILSGASPGPASNPSVWILEYRSYDSQPNDIASDLMEVIISFFYTMDVTTVT